MLHRIARFYLWLLRIAAPLTLAGMLVIPFVLDPPAAVRASADAHVAGATLVAVGTASGQYSFLQLPNPAMITVQSVPSGHFITSSRPGGFLFVGTLAFLVFLTWWSWHKRTPPNNSFKPNPLRWSA